MARSDSANTDELSFSSKVWVTTGIVSLTVVLLLLIVKTFSVFLLILAAALVALFFHGLSGIICKYSKWRAGVCLLVAVLGTLLIVGGLLWLMGAKLSLQISEFSDTLPKTIENAKEQLNKTSLGQKAIQKVSSPGSAKKAQQVAATVFQSTFGIFGDLYVILFLGIFFTVSPEIYKRGLVKLVPSKGKDKMGELLQKLGTTLQKWLKGKLFAMMVVFVLTSIGLLIIGMPLWLVLALIAGILNFIPNFGPLLALIPAVLVALMQSPTTAAIVAGMYVFIQVLESNFITPMVQKKLISVPPALIIIAQLLIAPLTGAWGLVLATPLMLIVMVVVNELYIER